MSMEDFLNTMKHEPDNDDPYGSWPFWFMSIMNITLMEHKLIEDGLNRRQPYGLRPKMKTWR